MAPKSSKRSKCRPAIRSTPFVPRVRRGARCVRGCWTARAGCSRSAAWPESIADIAAAADAFPSQITYYFRTKEALFVEAACRDMLYVARAAEQAALRPTRRGITPARWSRGDGDGFGRLLFRSDDADAPPPGSGAVGGAHH